MIVFIIFEMVLECFRVFYKFIKVENIEMNIYEIKFSLTQKKWISPFLLNSGYPHFFLKEGYPLFWDKFFQLYKTLESRNIFVQNRLQVFKSHSEHLRECLEVAENCF
jgi:hypothetical protein